MASIEKFIRAAQAPEKVVPKSTPAEKPTGATGPKIGRAEKAVVKPKAQTPFDDVSGGERATHVATGQEVVLDIATTGTLFLSSTALVRRIVLRCSGYGALNPSDRVLQASVFAQISGGPAKVEIAGANDATYLYGLGFDPEVGLVRGPSSAVNASVFAHVRASGNLSAAAYILTAGGRFWTGDAVPIPIPDPRSYPFALRPIVTFVEGLGLWRVDSPESWTFG